MGEFVFLAGSFGHVGSLNRAWIAGQGHFEEQVEPAEQVIAAVVTTTARLGLSGGKAGQAPLASE